MSEQRAILAGGCFWGMQDLGRRYDIVFDPERTSLTPLGITVGALPVNDGASGLAAN